MSDRSPLRLAENGQSSPSQSLGSQGSQTNSRSRPITNNSQHHPTNEMGDSLENVHNEHRRRRRENADHTRSQSESSSKSGQLRYGARNVIELFIPVSICMTIVIGTMKATDSYRYSSQTAIWYAQVMFTDQTVDTGTRVWQSLANALIMLVFIIVMTTVLILLYKFKFYATIHGWLILSSLMLLFMFTLNYIAEILKVYNIPMDNYTLMVFVWNFGLVGMICIHWKGPLLLQQAYLITISAFMALVLIRCLPDWTIWTVLGIVSVWDLVAVLCPRGPLRILVETAQERNEPIFPALIYSSMMVWQTALATPIVSTLPSISMADNQRPRSKPSKSSKKDDRQNSVMRRPPTMSSGSTSSQANSSNIATPVKRNQHPVEIHYEDGAQPPEVAFVQPNISGSSETADDWHRPVVRGLNSSRNATLADGQTVEVAREAAPTATELTINFHPSDARAEQQTEEDRGVKLGLGDFIFFSVLVGKASSYGDWTITASCYVAILVGLCLTLSLLAVFRKALPALPISIAFGLVSAFLSYVFVVPFAEELAINQVFV